MSPDYFLATNHGLTLAFAEGGEWTRIGATLENHHVTSVIAREGVILAGTTEGVFRSDDLGRTWRDATSGLAIRHVRWLAYHPAVSDFELAGTEPAGLFVSRDGAASWQECPEVGQLRDELKWFLPYSPEAGCVRGFACHGDRLYAAVEVGGMLRSDDRGASWRLADGSDGIPRWGDPIAGYIHPDVHSVAVHPSSPDRVFAPTGGGFYVSVDGGRTWQRRHDPCYCRAVWVDPDDADHLLLGPADSVDRNGRIEETFDGGGQWALLDNGLDSPWSNHMVERFIPGGDHLFAVLSNGHLLVSPIGQWSWRYLLSDTPGINSIAKMT